MEFKQKWLSSFFTIDNKIITSWYFILAYFFDLQFYLQLF